MEPRHRLPTQCRLLFFSPARRLDQRENARPWIWGGGEEAGIGEETRLRIGRLDASDFFL
jgi:hypothetical protein